MQKKIASSNSTPTSPSEQSVLEWALYLTPLVVLALFSFHDWWGPDSWYHLFLGKASWQQGVLQPKDNLILHQEGFFNQYWLFQTLIYQGLNLFGDWGLHLVVLLFWVGVFWTWSSFFRKTLPPVATSLILILGIVFFQHRMEFRPEICSYLFTGLSLQLIYRWIMEAKFDSGETVKSATINATFARAMGLWAAIQWTWSQCHGYFFVGTVLMAVASIGEWVEGRRKSALGFFILALTGALAVCLPPLGWRSWWDFWHLFNFLHAMSHGIEEFLPSFTPMYLRSWSTLLFWAAWFSTLALMPLSRKSRGGIFRLLLTALALYLSARHYRNIPLLPLFCAPFWADVAAQQLPKLQARLRKFENSTWIKLLPAVPLLLCVFMSWAIVTNRYQWSRYSESRFSLAPSPTAFPVHAVEYLKQNHFEGKIFNEPSDGGYLEFHIPELRPYGDSRFVDAEPVTEYFRALIVPKHFDDLHQRNQFDGALLWILRQQDLTLHLLKDPNWRLAYCDLYRAFFVNRNSEKMRTLPEWRNWSALANWSHGDNPARTRQWLQFFSHLRRKEEFVTLLSKIEEVGAKLKDTAEFVIQTGVEQRDAEIIARGEALLKRVH